MKYEEVLVEIRVEFWTSKIAVILRFYDWLTVEELCVLFKKNFF